MEGNAVGLAKLVQLGRWVEWVGLPNTVYDEAVREWTLWKRYVGCPEAVPLVVSENNAAVPWRTLKVRCHPYLSRRGAVFGEDDGTIALLGFVCGRRFTDWAA